MRLIFRTLAWLFRALLRTRNDLAMENMALRQQLSVYGQLKVKPRLKTEDRVFWVLFSMGYRSWRTCLKFVQPRTVLRWHAAGFKIFWRRKCAKTGRPRIPKQHQDLIRQMSIDEPGWGTDRIADELRLKLGIRHAASTVQKYMVRPEHRTRTGQTWRTLMKNHKDEIWSCDFPESRPHGRPGALRVLTLTQGLTVETPRDHQHTELTRAGTENDPVLPDRGDQAVRLHDGQMEVWRQLP